MACDVVGERRPDGGSPGPGPAGVFRCDELDEIVELTREMLAKAEAGAWEALSVLEARRGILITRYFSAPRTAGPDREEAVRVQELRDLNDRILEISDAARRRLMDALSDSQRQRDAAAHYHHQARFG